MAMKLHIEHTTIFSYEEPISEAYTEMRLRPLEGAGQRCLRFKLVTQPSGEVMQYTDRFGNLVHHFDTLQSHDRVVVKASSDVSLSDVFVDEQRELSALDSFDYLTPGKYTPLNEEIRSFAAPHVVPHDQSATAFALMGALYSSLQYERGATHVRTTAPEALSLGRGVCQDFAHILLAACRAARIPARYVSGYLYSPEENEKADETTQSSGSNEHQLSSLVDDLDAPPGSRENLESESLKATAASSSVARESQGTDSSLLDNAASHAWVDAFVNGRGWISLDPTHNCEQNMNYVRVGVGRDYSDVPPTRGVYRGTAKESLSVNVVVRAV